MAQLATHNTEDALDLVQDSMLQLVKRYAERDESEWPGLFHRILQNRIRDWYRRQKVKQALFGWLGVKTAESEDIVDKQPDTIINQPEQRIESAQMTQELETALKALPVRQQQVFLLRIWEGLDVRQTAETMQISEGSVKTHFSRAVHSLRDRLQEHQP